MTQLVTPPPPCADKGKTVAIGLFAHLRRTALLALLLAFGWAAQAQTGQNLTVKVNALEALTAQASLEAAIAASKVPLNQISSIVVQAGTFTVDDWKYLRDNKKQLSALTAFQIDVEAAIPNSDGSAGAYFSNKLNTFRAQSLKKIGAYAFMNCNALSFVYIPAVDTIENSAFSSCTSLRSIAFGSVKAVGSKVFAGCTKLTMASLGVEKLSAEVFNNCSALASVELTSVTEIYNAFKGCVSLTTLKLDMEDAPTVKYPNHAFQDCPTVRYLEIADSKKSIYKQIADGNTSDDLWYGWDFATSPDLLTGVLSSKTEGDHNFSNSNSIEEAIESTGVVYSDIEKIKITSGSFLPRDWYFLRAFRKDITKLHTIEILTPTEVPSTKSGDPFVNTNFGSLIAPQATSIGDYAFYKCNFYIVNLLNVQRIGSGVFANNANLHTVTLPNVTSIGSKAFENCKNLGNIKLPYAPPTVSNENAFTGCPTPRFLKFVKSDGSNPTSSTEDQNAVTAALANYKAVQDGNNTDEFWYGWGMEPYEKLKAKINGGAEIENSSLQSIISNSGISKDQITSIEITAGNFLQADWEWLQGQKNALTQLQTFKVATLVEIPNSKESYFNAKLTEFDAPEAIGVGSHAFDGCVNLATINLPKVKTIGASAFKRCALESISFPEVVTIGNSAFAECAIKSIDFGAAFPNVSKTENIGTGLFSSNSSLESVTWNKNAIGDFMFVQCGSLTTVNVPASFSTVGERAFYGCVALENIELSNVSTIRKEAFKYCYELENIVLSKAYTILEGAFGGCSKLVDVELPAAVSIGKKVFQDCSALVSVAMPALTRVSDSLFFNCRQLSLLKLKSTPPAVGVDAFEGCPSPRFLKVINTNGNELTGTDLDNARANYRAVNDGDKTDNLWYGWRFDEPVQLAIKVNGEHEGTGNSLAEAVAASTVPEDLVVNLEIVSGDFLTSDALYMRSNLVNVETLTMSAEIQVLGVEFNHPTLKEFNGPEVKSVGSYVFQNCTSLTTANLPLATSVGEYAFYGCAMLASMDLPLATSVGDYAFYSCSTLTTVSLPVATSVGEYVFRECGELTSVSLSEATSVGEYAFYNCSKLTTVSLPEAVSIGKYAFYYCKALEEVSLPVATSIGSYAFQYCYALQEVDLPAVISVGYSAFSSCTTLTTVSLPMATSIGGSAFDYCRALEKVELPAATSIGSYALARCTSLTEVSLPVATSIENYVFFDCSALEKVSLPVAASIGNCAFRNCSALSTIELGDTPPTVSNSNAFMNCPSPRSLTLVDAEGNLLTGDELATAQAAYRAAADDNPTDNLWYGWSLTDAYAIAATASPAEGGSVDGVGSYISGSSVTLTATANEGYKFVRWTGGGIEVSTANPYTFECTVSRTLQAVFEKEGGEPTVNTYTLSYTASAGGSIKGASVQKVKHGESGTEVEAMASDGHRFVKWSDGLTTAKRTDTNVTKNLSVTAEFEKKEEGGATGLFDAHLESLSVYPNPTQGAVQVEATGMVLVYNINGQLLQRVPSQGKVLIDLSGYPDGMYFIRVGNARAKVVKK